jgi:anti-sigma regulatory factor (Ser/Thr protein kinase)
VYRLEFALRNAHDLDEVARVVLAHLAALPGATRVGIAFTEGAGRRLRYAEVEAAHGTDGVDAAVPEGRLGWRHIDAYDDVPLTTVARTGNPVHGNPDDPEGPYAAAPLAAGGSTLGGFIVFFDAAHPFDAEQQRVLEAVARRTTDAVRRVRALRDGRRSASTPDDPALAEETYRASLTLEPDPRSAGAARRFLRVNLAEWGVDDEVVDSAELCVSELVTNVIMHAGTPCHLTVHLEEGSVGVLVRDGGEASGDAVPTTDEDPLRVSGRGLTLIDALAQRWGTHTDEHGTIAWFVLGLPAA